MGSKSEKVLQIVLHSILAMARGRRGQIALACAATCIAAELLPLGDTVHKKFGVPLQVDHTVWAGFNKPRTQLYQCIMQAKMIVIDEVFSLSYDVLACVERTLREVHPHDSTLGAALQSFSLAIRASALLSLKEAIHRT